jgi:hypothetical protein
LWQINPRKGETTASGNQALAALPVGQAGQNVLGRREHSVGRENPGYDYEDGLTERAACQ